MEETKKKRKYMVPTIIFAVVALILAIIASVILPVSVKQAMAEFSEENDGAAAAVAAPFVAVVLVLFIFISFAAGILSIPLLIVNSCLGLRSYVKWVKITAIVTDVLYGYVIIVAIFKLIQLLIGA